MLTAVRSLLPQRATRPARVYTFIDLGSDERGTPLLPVALNAAGDICVKVHDPAVSGLVHGFILRGSMRIATGSAVGFAPATALSESGLVAGATGPTLRDTRASASHQGDFGERHWPGAISFACGVNVPGETVGNVWFDAGEFMLTRAFLLSADAKPRFLVPPHGGTTTATAINDAGDIAFNSTPLGAPREDSHAWCLRNRSYVPVSGLGGRRAWAAALTPGGRIAGHALTVDGATHAFLWEGGASIDLGAPDGGSSEALAANDRRTVVGRHITPDGHCRAFRWTPETGPQPLDTLVSAPRGWALHEAVGINARGAIVGTGFLRGKPRGWLLQPVNAL